METKTCTKCGEVKGLAEFSKHARNKTDGRKEHCKACRAAHYRAHREIELRQMKEYRQANHDAIAERKRNYRQENRENIADKQREYRQANREVVAEKKRAYYRANREAVRAAHRGYYQENPGVFRAAGHRRRANLASATIENFKPVDMYADWEEHDLWDCFYCGCALTSENLDIEHFYPLSPDDEAAPPGPHALLNLVPSCRYCNRGAGGKHSREPWAFLREALNDRGVDLDRCLNLFDADGNLRRS